MYCKRGELKRYDNNPYLQVLYFRVIQIYYFSVIQALFNYVLSHHNYTILK